MNVAKSKPVVYLLVSLASVFVITWGIKASAFIISPILLAAVITIVVLPMPQYLSRRGVPGWLSFVLTLLMVVGGLAVIVLLLFYSFTNLEIDSESQETILNQLSALNLDNGSIISGLFGTMARSISQMFMVMLIFIFMLSGALVTQSLNQLGPEMASLITQVTQLTQDVRRYMSIMTGINFAVAVGNVILLWIVGVESALVWGLLSFVTGFIPTVGFWIALIPPVLIAYSTMGLQSAAVVFFGYVIINGSVQNLVQPRMMGQGLGISTVVVFISLFVWGWLLGGIGAILSVPLTMIIIAALYNFEATRWIAILMSAPRSEKGEDSQRARKKLGSLWQRARETIQGGTGNDVATTDEPS